MTDYHVDTYRDQGGEGMCRAFVVETSSGTILYTTWPYRSRRGAVTAAWRWVHARIAEAENPSFPLLSGPKSLIGNPN